MKNSLYVHTNGVQCSPDVPSQYDGNKIVFVGNMRTLQNQDAVHFFISNIFPIVKKEIPQAVFYIVGAEAPIEIINFSDNRNIVVTGFVQSIENEIKNAAVSIAPFRIAAGIQNKILISMACGLPIVLTSTVAGGIPELVSEKNCFIADEKQDFASAVITLMKNKNERNRIGKNGYELMKRSYSWSEKLNGYEDILVS
jgi:glycosyltransferase involved in cell wall biosynthesis